MVIMDDMICSLSFPRQWNLFVRRTEGYPQVDVPLRVGMKSMEESCTTLSHTSTG